MAVEEDKKLDNKSIEIKGKGIKVKLLSSIFIALGAIVMVLSIVAIKVIYDRYDEMREAFLYTENESGAAQKFKAASDYLTEQSIKYVATGDIKYVDNYFEEKDNSQNREAAVAVISNNHDMELELDLLHDAMSQSEELVGYELHAMKLVAVATGVSNNKMSDELAAYQLDAKELALSSEEQRAEATQIMYSKEYETIKDRINWDIENASALIRDESGARFRENEDSLITILNFETMMIFVMFILLVLIFIFNSLLVVKPASIFLEALHNHEKLPVIGGYEFRKFARKYNDVYLSNKKNRELLREQDEIDEVTGVLKAGTLDIVRHNLSQNSDCLAIMMVDIDNFRSIKESNGYDVADKLVAKVAKLFSTSFKSSDYVIRTSQDEFELFLPKMVATDFDVVYERIAKINSKLGDSSDGIPAASVSVGIAFSESGYNVETERKADMALNNVKENGRKNCKKAD